LKKRKRPLIRDQLPDGLIRRKTWIVTAEDQLNFLQSNLDRNFFSRLWLKIFKQGLIFLFQTRSGSRLKFWFGSIKIWF